MVDELQHSTLDFVVFTRAAVEPCAADGVDLVEEDDARLLAARHLEELADHPRTLTNILLHELGADDTDEGGVGAVRDGTGTERLARARRPVEEDAFWWVDAEVDEAFGL